MQPVKTILAAAILFFLLIPASFGADVAKIGVVDFQLVLTTSSAGKLAQAEINERGKAMKAELEEKGAAIEKEKESFERESLVMSKEMRDEKVRELRIMVNDFKALQNKFKKEFERYEAVNVQGILKEVNGIIEELAKKEGYLLVIERRDGGLLYFPKSIDLTDRVIQIYNARFAARPKSGEAADAQ